MGLFESASRQKLRFDYRGVVSVEDLWDIPVEGLDRAYKSLNAQLKEEQEESLLEESKENATINLKIDIIKHIVQTKVQERKEREDRELRADRKRKLLGIVAQKQNEELAGKSIEELNSMIDELDS